MLARFRSWWGGRSRLERLLVAIGVPVAAIAALWGARQDRTAAAAEGLDAEGGPGTEAAITAAGGAPNVINTGAPGVNTSDLSSFTEAFTGELGVLEERLEVEFGQSANERAQAAAERQAERAELEERFEGVERAAEAAGRKADKARQAAQETGAAKSGQSDPLASLRAAVMGAYRAEGVDPPSSGTVSRIAAEVRDGRTISSLRGSIRNNEIRQGRRTVAQSRAYWSQRKDKAGSPGV